jgi:hypothetical protein
MQSKCSVEGNDLSYGEPWPEFADVIPKMLVRPLGCKIEQKYK